jgi:hypothetical protein
LKEKSVMVTRMSKIAAIALIVFGGIAVGSALADGPAEFSHSTGSSTVAADGPKDTVVLEDVTWGG